jgi:hypothetical protein
MFPLCLSDEAFSPHANIGRGEWRAIITEAGKHGCPMVYARSELGRISPRKPNEGPVTHYYERVTAELLRY